MSGIMLMTNENNDIFKKLIKKIYDKKESYDFRKPVNYKNLGWYDYPNIIKNPMDLSTLKNNCLNQKYKFLSEAINDLQLIWDNCKLYNSKESYIYEFCIKLEEQSKSLLEIYFPALKNINKKIDKENYADYIKNKNYDYINNKEISILENRLEYLNNLELIKIINIIKELSPYSLIQFGEEDYKIFPEKIDRITYNKINKYIDNLNYYN